MYWLHGGTKNNIKDYNRWSGMLYRCYNPKAQDYANYGGRGIIVCDRWRFGENSIHPFICFLSDIETLGPRPLGKYSIDRINNDGNYELSNIRWATVTEQANNRRFTEQRLEQIRNAAKSSGRKAVELGLGVHALTYDKRREIGKLAGKKTGELMVNLTCSYCGKAGRGPAMYRWHLDNCKRKGS